MTPLNLAAVFAAVAICSKTILALSNDPPLLLHGSGSNSSALGAPSEFDIEYSLTRDYGPPLNENAIYMTAVTALEDLCFRDQSSTIPGWPHVPFRSPSSWSLPQYDIYLELSSHQVRFAIWGLQIATGDARKGGLWPMIGKYSWRGDFAGQVDIGNKKYPLPALDDGSALGESVNNKSSNRGVTPKANLASIIRFINATTATTFLEGAKLTIDPRYRGEPLSPRAVFGTAIDVMVLGAESGPNTYCVGLQRAGLEVTSLNNAMGEPLLKYKSLIRAMSILMSWMESMHRYGEIDVEILRDKIPIGKVRIKKRVRSVEDS